MDRACERKTRESIISGNTTPCSRSSKTKLMNKDHYTYMWTYV